MFDLTCRIPESILKSARDSQQVLLERVSSPDLDNYPTSVLDHISDILAAHHARYASSQSIRVCIPALGSPQWGDLSPQASTLPLSPSPHVWRPLLLTFMHASSEYVISYIVYEQSCAVTRRHVLPLHSPPTYVQSHGADQAGSTRSAGYPMHLLLSQHSVVSSSNPPSKS